MTEEEQRLRGDEINAAGWLNWKHWGPYLSERAWGTVREDYSADGSAWTYFPHDHARSRVYRWNEDGLLGVCDAQQFLCFSLALWNGQDAILKERPFGLTGPQGNHGEDVKDYYFFLDSTPTHSYMKALYKYPQRAFPYEALVEENGRRGKNDPEFELIDTGVFAENRYFDVFVEYAKADTEDLLIRISIVNCGPETASLDLLPTLWFRNTWSWGEDDRRPSLHARKDARPELGGSAAIQADHPILGSYLLVCETQQSAPELLFTDNETNQARLFPPLGHNVSPFVKDGINDYVVQGSQGAVNPGQTGTKAAARYPMTLAPGETRTVRLRLAKQGLVTDGLGTSFDATFARRIQEADAFYATVAPATLSDDAKNIQRQAFAGMLWSKQYYHYNIRRWLEGDSTQPSPPAGRCHGRNAEWTHLDNARVMSMPDTWEYPWYAAWDLAFHAVTFAIVDSEFAKSQLLLLLREWYMHPNGQLPAYEWQFGDVNPPVHAWAAMRVYQIEKKMRGVGDVKFLERIFHKLLLNFTWWVNRKDLNGRNVFQGGFLGLDNIGVFDRSKPLPFGGHIDQSDGTSWMAMYCLNLLSIALELAGNDSAYEDVATKFLEHYFYIAHAMNDRPGARSQVADIDLWDEQDGFYYDVLHLEDGTQFPLRVRSIVGLIPMLAVETLEPDLLEKLPDFKRRLEWFIEHRPDLCAQVASVTRVGRNDRRLFSVVNATRLRQLLTRVLDEAEFLSPYGLRALSRHHKEHPYTLTIAGMTYTIDYEPAESTTELFGGNSNWRGPIWFPVNYLLIEAIQKFDYYFGEDFKVEFPTGSGHEMTLWEVSVELSRRMIALFERDTNGRRPVNGGTELFQTDARWKDLITFSEYFHGDNGAGLGASHQTGWTGLVAKLIQQSGQ